MQNLKGNISNKVCMKKCYKIREIEISKKHASKIQAKKDLKFLCTNYKLFAFKN